jgi:uncharacterized tellurite resistance protein B-like protein
VSLIDTEAALARAARLVRHGQLASPSGARTRVGAGRQENRGKIVARRKKSSPTGCLVLVLVLAMGGLVVKLGPIALVLGAAFAITAFVFSQIRKASTPTRAIENAAPEIVVRVRDDRRSGVRIVDASSETAHLSPSAAPRGSIGKEAAFFGRGVSVQVAGREIRDPLTYVASSSRNVDAGTIITSLAVGNAKRAGPLPYWPSYADANPDQRALHLEWMAGGRRDTSVPISYPFIFFYGLERRALIDHKDAELCRAEVLRLLDLFAAQSGSFRGYATRFLSFLPLARWSDMDERELRSIAGTDLASADEVALATALAWYCNRGVPLPSDYAAIAASMMEDAKAGIVVRRARPELFELFAIRYGERFGSGLLLQAGKNPRIVEYHPASATLLRMASKPKASIPDVLARRAQFKPLVEIWNGCVDDLRKLSTKKAGAPEQITRELWEAMPEELRAQVDHPDLDRWLETVSAAPHIGNAHLLTAGTLASLAGFPEAEKITAAQSKKLAQAAAQLGFAVEPELRIAPRALPWEMPIAVWRATETQAPDAAVYVPASALLSLLVSIVLADGQADHRELSLLTTLVEDAFVLDDNMRQRLSALREILLRIPAKANALAKRLRETKTREQLQAVGRMLVAVAAADGVLADGELKSLKSIFKALGLTSSDLDALLVASGLRLKSDEVVRVADGSMHGGRGEAVPPPPEEGSDVVLDQAAIARIMAETHEVAAILADVFDTEEPIDVAPAAAQASTIAAELPAVLAAASTSPLGVVAHSLDLKYHALVAELIVRADWSEDDAKALARRHRLMPGGVLEAVNAWSEDELGDALIDEGERWSINAVLAERLRT